MGKSVFDPIDLKKEWVALRKAIELSGFSIRAVCKNAGVSTATIFAWDKGTREISAAKINKMKASLKSLIQDREKKMKEIK